MSAKIVYFDRASITTPIIFGWDIRTVLTIHGALVLEYWYWASSQVA